MFTQQELPDKKRNEENDVDEVYGDGDGDETKHYQYHEQYD